MTRVEIRPGSAADLPVVMAMLDGAVAWLDGAGRSGQWGSEPWSADERKVAKIAAKLASDTVWIAEVDGAPAGALTHSPDPMPYVAAADEPELYVTLLVTDRAFAGHGIGGRLLAHACDEARRQGVELVRVDCYAGGDGQLVSYYRRNGFEPVETFTVDGWPGQLLRKRVAAPA
jgi:GNAT superfamily N-acetyltransferase